MNARSPEACRFRHCVERSDGRETATCGLLVELTGCSDPETVRVQQDACEACCEAAVPDYHNLNEVVASLLFDADARATQHGGRVAALPLLADELRRRAWESLPTFRPIGPQLEEIIDADVSVETLTELVANQTPFAYLRYGDGEWLSVLGVDGHNCDRHSFLPDSLGRELRQVLRQIADMGRDNERLYVGTTCELHDHSDAFLRSHRMLDRVHWVSDALFRVGLPNLKTRDFIAAVMQYQGVKVLVGNRFLRPVARALGCRHVVIPLRDCYRQIDRLERACRFDGPGLVICCASMASECLIWRLYRRNPHTTYVDCGSIFDGMIGRMIRREMREMSETMRLQYAPLFPTSR